MKTARPNTTGWLSLSETEDELESLSSVCTVTQGDYGTGAGGVGWSEAEAGRSLGKRCGSLRDMTTFVFLPTVGPRSACQDYPLGGSPEDGQAARSIFCQKTGF